MTISSIKEGTRDVPAQIFEEFLRSLGSAGVSVELIARLRKTLLEDRIFSEGALKEAILSEESSS